MLYRRFGYLQARVLLEKQDVLRALEEELKELDYDLHQARPENNETRVDIDDDMLQENKDELLARIEKAYCEYCE